MSIGTVKKQPAEVIDFDIDYSEYFDGVGGELADGLKTVADFPNLVAGLQARGYDDAGIGKILGGNLLRTWARIEAGAGKTD